VSYSAVDNLQAQTTFIADMLRSNPFLDLDVCRAAVRLFLQTLWDVTVMFKFSGVQCGEDVVICCDTVWSCEWVPTIEEVTASISTLKML
jgi:hypothetical protein